MWGFSWYDFSGKKESEDYQSVAASQSEVGRGATTGAGPLRGATPPSSWKKRRFFQFRNRWAVGHPPSNSRLGFEMKELVNTVVEKQPSNRSNKGLRDMARSNSEQATIQELKDNGCNLKDISEALYTMMHRHPDLPNFLPHVRLDRDGGLDRLDKVWYDQRYFWCAIAFLAAVCNLGLMLTMNYSVFRSIWAHYFLPVVEHAKDGVTLSSLLDAAGELSNIQKMNHTAEQEQIMKDSGNQLFDHIEDRDIRIQFMMIATTIAIFEIVGILAVLIGGLKLLLRFAFASTSDPGSEFRAFSALERFFRRYVPLLGTFSALKLACWVHPSLIYTNYVDTVREASCGKYRCGSSQAGVALVTVAFIVSRILCATVALMAFAAKVVVVASKLTNPYYRCLRSWAEALALLNCCIGAVVLEQQLQDRMFLFIFGGGDADYQDDERCLRDVYRARLAKQIWTDYWQKRQKLKAVVFLATLDHYDLQALVMEASDVEIIDSAEAWLPGNPTATGTLIEETR